MPGGGCGEGVRDVGEQLCKTPFPMVRYMICCLAVSSFPVGVLILGRHFKYFCILQYKGDETRLGVNPRSCCWI